MIFPKIQPNYPVQQKCWPKFCSFRLQLAIFISPNRLNAFGVRSASTDVQDKGYFFQQVGHIWPPLCCFMHLVAWRPASTDVQGLVFSPGRPYLASLVLFHAISSVRSSLACKGLVLITRVGHSWPPLASFSALGGSRWAILGPPSASTGSELLPGASES